MDPSPSQKLAIEAEPGSLLVLAGPGAGKTFCLTERIRFLIERRGFDPARICAFTFTNKAAGEIAERLERRLGTGAEKIKRGTIHAFCADLLREFAPLVGLETGFGIADEEYQLNALRRIEGYRKWHRQVLTRFSAHRFRGDELMHNDSELFKHYESFLAARNLVDFDMLVIKAADLVESSSAADTIRARWDVVLVDEFQDLNPVQYRVVRGLAAKHRHVFAVGDDDQSIYSWAGADPAVFRHFVNDFGITARIHLGENHRCPADIFALARKLVDVNQPIFGERKSPLADRRSAFPVQVPWFETDEDEARWLVNDIRRDRDAHKHQWGDVALLYRKHEIGDLLETTCIDAGVPVRRAQGRSLADDPVIGYVVAAMRVIHTPSDDLHREAFFHVVLPHAVFDEARAKAEEHETTLWSQLSHMAAQLPRAGDNARQIRRALADCRNLEAVGMQQSNLMALVQELLARRVGRLQSILDQHHDDLTDPLGIPEVVTLADRLRAARAKRQVVLVPAMGGAEIPIKSMLDAIRVRAVCEGDESPERPIERLSTDDATFTGLALGVFKAAQLLEMESSAVAFTNFTAVDLETTDRIPSTAEIVEIAAVRVRDGKVAETFSTFVKPVGRMHAGAAATTGIRDADLAGAPPIADVWPRFAEFCGDDVLVAHNGYDFDFPILSRVARELGATFESTTFDSLPLARMLLTGSGKLGDIARHFEIDTGQSHRALDDTKALALVMLKLGEMKLARSRKTALVDQLGNLGLALALSDPDTLSNEAKLFRDRLTTVFVLGKYGTALDTYEDARATNPSLPTMEYVINRLGGPERMAKIQRERTADERYPAAMRRLRRLIAGLDAKPFEEQMSEFLQRVTLSKWDGEEPAHERVNLLTLHSTKGLEFSRVYVVGCEDSQLPGGGSKGPTSAEVEEGRRLLYVGMTRTIDRLVMTYCAKRGEKDSGGHRFLDEMGLRPTAL